MAEKSFIKSCIIFFLIVLCISFLYFPKEISQKLGYERDHVIDMRSQGGEKNSRPENQEVDPILLTPPSQAWIKNQYRHLVSLLGFNYTPPNKWEQCRNKYNTLYFPKLNTVFTGVPKAGCTNWYETLLLAEGALKDRVGKENRAEIHWKYVEPYRMRILITVNRTIAPELSFAVVRNPWTRLVSAYQDRVGHKIGLQIKRFLSQNAGTSAEGTDLRPTFEEFLRYIIATNGSSDYHFLPVTQTLCLKVAEYDLIVPLEHALVLVPQICEKLGISVDLPSSYDLSEDPRSQRSAINAKEWFSKMDPAIIDKIYEFFKPDFMLMNYSNFTDPNFPMPNVYNTLM